MKKKLRARPTRTIDELKTRIIKIWDSLTPEDCQKLVLTMSYHITTVWNAVEVIQIMSHNTLAK